MQVLSSVSLVFGFILFALGHSLLSVWIALVTLQLTSHTVLMNLATPSQVFLLLRRTLALSRFLLDSDTNGVVEDAVIDVRFDSAGYTSTEWYENMSLAMLCTLVLLLLALIVGCLGSKLRKAKRFFQYLVAFAMLGLSYCILEVTLCALIDIQASESSPIAIMILILAVSPILGLFLLYFKLGADLYRVRLDVDAHREAETRSID